MVVSVVAYRDDTFSSSRFRVTSSRIETTSSRIKTTKNKTKKFFFQSSRFNTTSSRFNTPSSRFNTPSSRFGTANFLSHRFRHDKKNCHTKNGMTTSYSVVSGSGRAPGETARSGLVEVQWAKWCRSALDGSADLVAQCHSPLTNSIIIIFANILN